MYTDSGKNHFNKTLAGGLASHIVWGIDKFNTSGDAAPLLTDRHWCAYESLSVPIVNRTVVDKNIVFATSHDTNRVGEFLSNNMSLYYQNNIDPPTIRTKKKVFNNFSGGWTGVVPLDDTNTPSAWFTPEGGAIIAKNTTVAIEGAFSLKDYKANDYLSIPVFWTGNIPTGGVMTVKFTFKVGGVDTTYELTKTVTSADAIHFKFPGVITTLHNEGALITTWVGNPQPTVFVARLGSGTTPTDFLNNLSSIWKVEITWTIATTTSLMYFGAPQITPDYDADNSGIVVSAGNLNAMIANSPDGYGAGEYRVIGI